MATEQQPGPNPRIAQISPDEIAADLREPDAAPGGQIRPLGALSPQCPDEKDLWLANGFVMADAEIIASLHYITCPPIIHRRGFQWRAPESRPGSRKNKRTRGNKAKRAA